MWLMFGSFKNIIIIILLNFVFLTNAETYAAETQKVKIGNLDNLYRVSDSVYRSEQPTARDFRELERAGIKSILNLRYLHKDSDVISKTSLKFYHVPMVALYMEQNRFIEALRIIKNSPKPILIHCQHGSDRTGAVIALYRIIFQKWSKEAAINELKYGGYGHHLIFFNIPNFIKNIDIKQIEFEINK